MNQNKKLVILTGINRGLGMALFDLIIYRKNLSVLGITRTLNQRQEDLLERKYFDCYLHDFTP